MYDGARPRRFGADGGRCGGIRMTSFAGLLSATTSFAASRADAGMTISKMREKVWAGVFLVLYRTTIVLRAVHVGD